MYPQLLHLYGPLSINTFGVMIVLGLLLFMYALYHHPGRRAVISDEIYHGLVMWGIVAGICGGRLYVLLTEWHTFQDNWVEIIYPWCGGFGIIGSIISILICFYFFLKRNNVPFLPVLDIVVLYVPLLQAMGRLGCFFAGCCYGIVAPNCWWAVTYTHEACLAPLGLPLHPTPLYSALASLAIFFILKYWRSPYRQMPGTLLWTYLMLEALARFIVEQWRADQVMVTSVISSAHIASIMLFLCGFFPFLRTLYRGYGGKKYERYKRI